MLKAICLGFQTGFSHYPVLTPEQLAQFQISAEEHKFDGDAGLFRFGKEAHQPSLSYEYDPFFSVSIARFDPLPHQIEAVNNYFVQLPRVRSFQSMTNLNQVLLTRLGGVQDKAIDNRIRKRTLVTLRKNSTYGHKLIEQEFFPRGRNDVKEVPR